VSFCHLRSVIICKNGGGEGGRGQRKTERGGEKNRQVGEDESRNLGKSWRSYSMKNPLDSLV